MQNDRAHRMYHTSYHLHSQNCKDRSLCAHAVKLEAAADSNLAHMESISTKHQGLPASKSKPALVNESNPIQAGEHATRHEIVSLLQSIVQNIDSADVTGLCIHGSAASGSLHHEAGIVQPDAGSTEALKSADAAASLSARDSLAQHMEAPIVRCDAEAILDCSEDKEKGWEELSNSSTCSEVKPALQTKDDQDQSWDGGGDVTCMPPAALGISRWQSGHETTAECVTLSCEGSSHSAKQLQPDAKLQLHVVDDAEAALLAGELVVCVSALAYLYKVGGLSGYAFIFTILMQNFTGC
jgi:hypothetical protein